MSVRKARASFAARGIEQRQRICRNSGAMKMQVATGFILLIMVIRFFLCTRAEWRIRLHATVALLRGKLRRAAIPLSAMRAPLSRTSTRNFVAVR